MSADSPRASSASGRLSLIRRLVDRLSAAPDDTRTLRALTILWVGHASMIGLLQFTVALRGGGGFHGAGGVAGGLISRTPPHLRASNIFLENYARWRRGDRDRPVERFGMPDDGASRLAAAFYEFMTTNRLSDAPLGLIGDFRLAIEFVRVTLPVLRNAGLMEDAARLEFFWGVIEHRLRGSEPVLVLSPGYLLNVGHCVITAAMIEAQRAGKFGPRSTAAIEGPTHNPFLVERIRRHMDPAPPESYRIGEVVDGSKTFVLKDGRRAHVMALLSEAGRVWSEQGRPFLRLEEEIVERGYAALERYGVRRGDRLVTLHVREPGFHTDTAAARDNDAAYHGMRNAPVEDYADVIDRVIAGGATIVRLGDTAMTPLGDRPGFIDYPFSDLKSDWMDIFLTSQCHYHIGTPSGMSFVPMLFGRPVVFTNWITLINIIDTPNVLTLFKPLFDQDGGLVPFGRFASQLCCLGNDKELEFHCVRHAVNDPEDIVDAVMLMDRHADRETGRLEIPDREFADCQARFGRTLIARRPKIPPAFWQARYGRG